MAAPGGGGGGAVSARVRYFARPAGGYGDHADADGVPVLTGANRRALTELREVPVSDARAAEARRGRRFRVDDDGIELARLRSAVTDFEDATAVRNVYHGEIGALVREVTGAKYAFVYNSLVRTEKTQDAKKNFIAAYARFVHIDAPLPPPADDGLVARFRSYLVRRGVPAAEVANLHICTVNTWQPWDRPAYRNPLALMDAASLDLGRDLQKYLNAGTGLVGSLRSQKQSADRAKAKAETSTSVVYNPSHRWLYWPQMQTDEVVIFKQLDTRADRSRCCPHTSFDDPTTPADAPGRRSIETRVLCAFPRRSSGL